MGVVLGILLGLDSLVFTALAIQIIRTIRAHRPLVSKTPLGSETDVPSVTVCIPARNEEHALAECLQRVVNSTYPKVEIIVLDDSSSDGTSLLIKSFAHAGVRFVRGAALPEGWLGKNHALLELSQQASGSYVLFLDVDTRLSPMTIEHMMRTVLSRGASMISVLPRRDDGLRASVVWSPLKYFWELARHREGSPAAASNAWIVKRSVIQSIFKNDEAEIKNAVLPEAFVASHLGNKATFLVSTEAMGVSYEKRWLSQCETSIRLLYPMLGNSPVRAVGASLALLALLIPPAIAITSLWVPFTTLHSIAMIITALFGVLYTYYTRTFWKSGWMLGFFVWPLIILQEAGLIVISMARYQRGRVLWKGRPIRSSMHSR